jgi:pimeloyl-ACP methyl ester carboxylesterase
LRFALAGHDFGGAVAMELLRLAPERVDRLCLMSTTALAETPAQAAAREPWIVRAQAGRLEDVLQEVIPADHFAQGSGRTDIVNLMRQMARDLGPEVFVRQMRASQRRRDYQATLRRCKAPTLILCGAEDPLTPPKRHAFMAELIAGARLEIIEGTGHAPTLETPERVTALWRDWLDAPFLLN